MQNNSLRSALAKMQLRGHVDAVDLARLQGALRDDAQRSSEPAQLIRRFS
jgi:hypothetical protein